VAEEDHPAVAAAVVVAAVGNCKVNRSFPINEWIILLVFVQKPVYLWCVNEISKGLKGKLRNKEHLSNLSSRISALRGPA